MMSGVVALLQVALVGCGSDAKDCTVDTTYQPVIDPGQFVSAVDNPLFPLLPGTHMIYKEGATGTVELTVLSERKTILGVSCVVVHDVAKQSGVIVEDTLDWYAQDRAGNVWYFGEDTKELANGQVVSTEGSWTAGLGGALPGLIIPATRTVGQRFRQEYLVCEAEDEAEILATDAAVTVPFGSYTGCLQTHDFTRLEPEANEQKWYCPGVGPVLAVDVSSGEREELTAIAVP